MMQSREHLPQMELAPPPSRGVRWHSSVYSPAALAVINGGHQRLSTREHYDFINHGIHPEDGQLAPVEGLTILTPSMISSPWPEAHVEMLANAAIHRTSAGDSSARNSIASISPSVKLQSSMRSTNTDDTSLPAQSPILDDGSREDFRHGHSRSLSANRRVSMLAHVPQTVSPGGSSAPTRVLLAPSSPLRGSLAFFSDSPIKATKLWGEHGEASLHNATPSLASAPFGRRSSLLYHTEIMSPSEASSSFGHSRESTHQSAPDTNDSLPGSEAPHTSPILVVDHDEQLRKAPRKGKAASKKGKDKEEPPSVGPSPVIEQGVTEVPPPPPVPSAASAPPAEAESFGKRATVKTLPAPGLVEADEWDRPDGARVVKLISEELQLALEKGSLTEPPSRYYVLPPGFGKSKSKPQSVSYAGMIGQAILTASDGRLSLAEIYHWINTTYPYFERTDRGWMNSIRHNLSLNKSFLKIERELEIPGKGGWWAIQPGHEDRFTNGIYQATPSREREVAGKGKPSKQPKTPASVPQNEAPAAVAAPAGPASSGARKRRTSDAAAPEAPIKEPVAGSSGTKRVKMSGRSMTTMIESSPAANTAANRFSQSVPMVTPMRSIHGFVPEGSGQSAVPMLTDSASSPPTSPFFPIHSLRQQAGRQEQTKSQEQHAIGALPLNTVYTSILPHSPMNPDTQLFNGSPVAPMRGNNRATYASRMPKQQHQHQAVPQYSPDRVQPMGPPLMTSMPMQSPADSQASAMSYDQQPQTSPGPAASRMAAWMRGSPMRGDAQGNLNSPNRSMLPPSSSAPLHMSGMAHYGTMHMGQQQRSHPLNSNGSTPARAAGVGTAPRWPVATPSPMRRGHGAGGQSGGNGASWLDDPFDYQGNLQHELDFTMDSLGHPGEYQSPARGAMWNNQQH